MENGQQFRSAKHPHMIQQANVLLNGTQQIDGFIDHAANKVEEAHIQINIQNIK